MDVGVSVGILSGQELEEEDYPVFFMQTCPLLGTGEP